MTKPQDNGPDGPYLGSPGRTRTEHVRVFRPAREPLEVEVFRVVNVGEHPDLRAPALSGDLHRLDDGEEVGVPYVYHDPAARQFALVIPDGARNRELSERRRLLDSLMDEQETRVPGYVRDFAVVYGHAGLQRYVEDAEAIEVDVSELEPVDTAPPGVASYFPKLAGLLPIAGFSATAPDELVPLLDGEELWLFVEVGPDEEDAFAESSSDLLIQLKYVDQLPVCVLSLVDTRIGVVRRAHLNPARSADAPIVDVLGRDFRGSVIVHDAGRRLLRAFVVEAPRAANAKLILQRADAAPAASAERWARAAESCRALPPPTAGSDHPFVLQPEATDAGEARRRLQQLERWSAPDRIDDVLLLLSVPGTVFELCRRRIVGDAIRFGLAMSNTLLLQAVRFGFAPDSRSLVASLKRRFEEIVPEASAHGLSDSETRANLDSLERLEALHGTSTAPDVSCTMEHSG